MAATVISFIVHLITQIADYCVWLHIKLQAYAKKKKKSQFADAGIEPGSPGHPPPQCTTIHNSIASQRSSDLDEMTLAGHCTAATLL